MPRLLVGNFDFEHRLSGRGATSAVARLNEELACVCVLAADNGDRLWLPASVEDGFLEGLAAQGLPQVVPVFHEADVPVASELCPWGWTDDLRRTARRHGWVCHTPPQVVVRAVNSRRFSWRLEHDWSLAPRGAAAIEAVEQLPAAVGRLPAGREAWVVKAEFGMSARERLLGRGRPSEQAMQWVRRRLRSDGIVFFEPWLERVDEVGLQFTVPPANRGEPTLKALTPLQTDASGTYQGSDFTSEPTQVGAWQEAVEAGRRAACVARQQGYFGPLGIDAMRYRELDGTLRIRPLQDINARHTMGRLSLGLRRLLRPGEEGVWLHVRWSAGTSNREWFDRLQGELPPGVRVVRTSPFEASGRPTAHGTLAWLRPPV